MFTNIVVGVLLFGLWVAPCAARGEEVKTRAGEARIVEGTRGKSLVIGDVLVDLPNEPFLAWIETKLGDLLLVAISQGGNACPAEYVWVHATPGAIRQSEVFGTCSDIVEVTFDSETVRVTMPSAQPGEGDVAFVYDGKNPITKIQHPLARSGMANPNDWSFWIGRLPYELFVASELQHRLSEELGPEGLRDAQTMLSVAKPMDRDRDWVVGTGCQPHMCSDSYGGLAANLNDGRIIVILHDENGIRMWGNFAGPVPKALVAVMENR